MRRLFLLLWLVVCAPAFANFSLDRPAPTLSGASVDNSADFLPVRQAFRLSLLEQTPEALKLRFVIADGYYLYEDRFAFDITPKALANGPARLPQGIEKHDQYFGDVLVHRGIIDIELPIQNPEQAPLSIAVQYQGCADKGLCYPPENETLDLGLSNTPSTPEPVHFSWQKLALFFLAGLGLTFTPCVLPMLPILSGVVLKGQIGGARGLSLSLAYVIPMALCFALLGALMGIFGAGLNLQARLQSPWVLVPFAGFFIVFALAMFGLFELRLPRFISEPLDRLAGRTEGGSLWGAAALGVLSSLLVSPCVSAPLAGALLYISTSGDALGGGLQLFALGLGMGAPLVVFATGGSALLPKSGTWMLGVRNLFGILLLGVAVWMLERVVPGVVGLGLWALLAFGVMLYCLRRALKSYGVKRVAYLLLSLLLALYSAAACIGVLQGGSNPAKPWAGAEQSERWQTVTSQAALNQALAEAKARQQPAVIDWYADWCISCKVIEREVLGHPEVVKALSEYALIRFDITQSLPEQRALLDHYQLFGPPALLFFDQQGAERLDQRVIGEIDAKALLKRLKGVTE